VDKIAKALAKLSESERQKIKAAFKAILSGKATQFDIKKLKGRNDVFRVRSGRIRVIYRKDPKGKIFFLSVARRNERTYRG